MGYLSLLVASNYLTKTFFCQFQTKHVDDLIIMKYCNDVSDYITRYEYSVLALLIID